jgi:hypothetical protein
MGLANFDRLLSKLPPASPAYNGTKTHPLDIWGKDHLGIQKRRLSLEAKHPEKACLVTDYLSTRQNPIPGAPIDGSNRMLEAIAIEFGTNWLESGGDNPLQQLWQRRDWLATAELLMLGDAIQRLSGIDASWTKRQINEIKSPDPGTRSGAAFELLGLNLFHGATVIEPTRANNPGYDGRIRFSDGSLLLLSIKNHGVTSGEEEFRARSASVRDAFIKGLQGRSMNGVQQRIITQVHPTTADWKRLEDQMGNILGGNVSPDATAPWSGIIQPLDARYFPLSADQLSYAILLAAPYRENEQKNFLSNIEKGIANLAKHHGESNSDICRGLLLRLSETAHMSDCATWVGQYFVQHPETPVEVVLLYQVVVATDLSDDTSFIAHYFLPILGPKYAAWHQGKQERGFNISVLIGKILRTPSRLVLAGGANVPQVALDGHYMFQDGKIFPYYRMDGKPLTISLSSPAAGVSVLPIIDGLGGSGSLSAIAPPERRLTLLR